MAVPKQRHTKSRRNKRRMHLYVEPVALISCPKCGKPVLPHIACKNCGYYKGVEVIDVMKKLDKKEKKVKEKEMASQEKAQEEKKPLTAEGLSQK